MKSFIECDMVNQDDQKYGTCYIFFPEKEGYPVADPMRDIETDSSDIWNQVSIEYAESLEEAMIIAHNYENWMIRSDDKEADKIVAIGYYDGQIYEYTKEKMDQRDLSDTVYADTVRYLENNESIEEHIARRKLWIRE